MGPGAEKTVLTKPAVSRRRRRLTVAVGFGLAIAAASASIWVATRRPPAPPPPPGIPLSLAEDRAARVANLRYELSLSVPGSRTDPIRGRLAATFSLSDATRPLAFDFAQPAGHLLKTSANGRQVALAPARAPTGFGVTGWARIGSTVGNEPIAPTAARRAKCSGPLSGRPKSTARQP